MHEARQKLEDRLRRDRDDILDLIQKMVRIPSENPPGDTTQLYAFVSDYLEKRGLDHETVAPQAHMPNLVATYEGGEPGKHLVLNGHLDIFPAGDPAFWSDDPFSGALKDNKLFGRGVSDMKVGTAASILTYVFLSEVRDALKGKLTLTATSDEETGGKWGAEYLVNNRPDVLGDCLLNGEPSTPGTLRFGEKGPTWLTMKVNTHGGHSAYAHQSSNAIIETAAIIGKLQKLTKLPVNMPPEVEAQVEAARAALDQGLGAGATETLKGVTVGVGVIGGGVKVNVIAAECVAEVDLRAPVGVTSKQLLEAFDEVLSEHPGATYTIDQSTDPSWSDPEHPMVSVIQQNALAVRGISPVPGIGIGATDCRLWRAKGVPAYVYGPTPYNMGAPDEYVTLDDLFGTVHVHVLSAFDYLTT